MTTAPLYSHNDHIAAIPSLVEQLKSNFAGGRSRDLAWRVEQLRALKEMMLAHQDRISAALKADLGKSSEEAWISEIGYSISEIEHSLKHLNKWAKPRKVSTPLAAQPGKSYLLPEPLGTVLIIGAWNYPFQLVIAPLVAAISAGNFAVLKPSELSINTSALLAELLPQYLDKEAFAVVEGAVEETTELVKQPFDHFFYTGGENVGRIVMKAAAEHLAPVTLELGGKSPCIVDSNCNLDVTAARIVWGKWMNAGQTCVAPDYVLVEKGFEDKLVKALIKKIEAFYGKDAAQSSDYGRIVNERHFARLQSYLADQNVVYGGQTNEQTRYMSPTLVMQPGLDSELMRQEIFGPILPIITLDNISDSIAFINQRSKPLALYLFSKNKQLENKVLNETSAGSVCVNDGMMFMVNPELPFGGVGHSGMGAYHGQFGFDTFSHLKSVMKRSFLLDAPMRYPPFTSFKFNLLKKFL